MPLQRAIRIPLLYVSTLQRASKLNAAAMRGVFLIMPRPICFLALLVLAATASAAEIRKIELSDVDADATGYGTFQSHNQKVLANPKGIFVTSLHRHNGAYKPATWRLSRSTDGGATFAAVYESVDATHPPCIETDEQSNIYLLRADDVKSKLHFYRFDAAREWQHPLDVELPESGSEKFTLLRDAKRGQFYASSLRGVFFIIAPDGTVRRATKLFAPGPHALQHYPLLSLDEAGVLHYAYTTTPIDNRYLYWSIHHIQSPDGGQTWQRMDGTPIKAVPIVADETGPSDRISLDNEFDVHTWLSNLMTRGGKAHFLYDAMANPDGEHYTRYDLKTGRRDIDVFPDFKGETLSILGLDGYFVAGEGQTLYALGHGRSGGGIVCLASSDNGATWHDFAATDSAARVKPYAIGGFRELTADGHIIGTFTDVAEPGPVKVRFMKIATR
jgi:hypothetical protein